MGNKSSRLTLTGHSDIVRSVSFSPDPDDASIVSGSDDTTVKVWSVESEVLQKTLEGQGATSVSFSPDGASKLKF